ncbi:hypothetical protein ACFZBU_39475 [Embleya sp. NPDC008237]|uniref:hypothetical protein n=1 Tax=Embleya sp. NPDC008237 TaxID=3363978 RepID=UPI0036E6F616
MPIRNTGQSVIANIETETETAEPLQHVVQFSGGMGSWAATQRVAWKWGTANLTLLIADTTVEDDDLWRFARETSEQVGVPLTIVRDGRAPWDVFEDVGFIGNNRVAPCTKFLKQIPCRNWLKANKDPANTVLYIGLDDGERIRLPGIWSAWKPWRTSFPLLRRPYLNKQQMMDWSRALGIEPPRLYAQGFSHNNCGGACVRAGQKQWKHLFEVNPERYRENERREEGMRQELGPYAVLRRTRNRVTRPLPLAELRREAEGG